ncbi:hypothetical protein BH10BDE1_BH10BDE1_26690 [soil metagenome]
MALYKHSTLLRFAAGTAAFTLATALVSGFAVAGTVETAGELPNPNSAISGSVQVPAKKSFFTQVGDRLASIDLKAKVKLLDVELIKGLKASVDYKYEVEPSYDGEYHLRMDRGTLSADANVGELIGRANQYVGVNFQHGTEFLYVRPFKSKGEAIKAIPFGFDSVPTSIAEIKARLPYTAQNVIDHLNVGDFFSFTAHLNLVVGLSSLPLSLATPGFIATHYLISGQFQVHIVKMEDQKVEIKLIALRQQEKGIDLVGGFGTGHKVFGLRVVDRRIEKLLNITEMFQMSLAKMKSNLAMVDYVLDMKDPNIREAYDGILAKVVEFKSLKIANPFQGNSELTDKLISDITPFETLFAAQASRPAAQRSVERHFKGKNDVDVSDRSKLKFAPIIFNFSRETEYFENMLTSSDASDTPSYYRLHTFQRTNTNSWWLSYYKAVSISRASILFDSNAKHEIGNLRDISFEWNYRDKSLTANELRMIKGAVKQAVPESVHSKINWGVFANETEYANARFIYKMILHPNSLQSIHAMGSGEIWALLVKYLKTIPPPSDDLKDEGRQGVVKNRFYSIEDDFKTSIDNISYYLSKVVDPALTNQQRSNAFAELRFNALFVEIGPGFLVSLLPPANLEKFVNFEITLTADDVAPMSFKFGSIQERKVYEAAQYMESVLTANEFETITQMMKSARTKEKAK